MQKPQGDNLFMDNTHNLLLPHTVIITCVLLVPFVFCHIAIYCNMLQYIAHMILLTTQKQLQY